MVDAEEVEHGGLESWTWSRSGGILDGVEALIVTLAFVAGPAEFLAQPKTQASPITYIHVNQR